MTDSCPNINFFECESGLSEACWELLYDALRREKWKNMVLIPRPELLSPEIVKGATDYYMIAHHFESFLQRYSFCRCTSYKTDDCIDERTENFLTRMLKRQSKTRLTPCINLEELVICYSKSYRLTNIAVPNLTLSTYICIAQK